MSKEEIHRKEVEFHDSWAQATEPESIDVESFLDEFVSPEFCWALAEIGSLNGLTVLELGAGFGEISINLAKMGASVTATDLSPEMVSLGTRLSKIHGVLVRFVSADASDLHQFDDEEFDLVVAANILHHSDIRLVLKEINRVLKPGGKVATWDPLCYNPIINLYRRIASGVRTEDEHPLTRRDVMMFKESFCAAKVRSFWLTANIVFLKFFIVNRLHPSKYRYWKVVLERRAQERQILKLTHKLDRRIFATIPLLRWFAWNIAMVGIKSDVPK